MVGSGGVGHVGGGREGTEEGKKAGVRTWESYDGGFVIRGRVCM